MPGANNETVNEEKKTKTVVASGAGAAGENETDQSSQAAGSADETDLGEGDFADPVKALAEIKKLRAENAKSRVKNKSLEDNLTQINGTMTKLKGALGIETDEVDPEKQVASLRQENEALQVQAAVNELCREHEIPRKAEKYFQFLIAQEFEALKEGEEISDERMLEISAEAKKTIAPAAATSTGAKTTKGVPNPDASAGSVSAAQFAKMNSGEKSALYVKNPEQYQKLFNEAKEKRLL